MNRVGSTLLLQGAILVFSFSSVLSKLAAQETVFSPRFLLFYAGALLLMAVYALVWQQFLKRMPLSTAYGNRAVSVIWSIVWGALFFHETIRWSMILGSLVIVAGLYLVTTADE